MLLLCMSATAGSLIQQWLFPPEPFGSRSTACDGTGGERPPNFYSRLQSRLVVSGGHCLLQRTRQLPHSHRINNAWQPCSPRIRTPLLRLQSHVLSCTNTYCLSASTSTQVCTARVSTTQVPTAQALNPIRHQSQSSPEKPCMPDCRLHTSNDNQGCPEMSAIPTLPTAESEYRPAPGHTPHRGCGSGTM